MHKVSVVGEASVMHLALKKSILSGWHRRSNGYVSNSLRLGFEVSARLSPSYLLGQSSIISTCSGAPESFQFLKIHENSWPGWEQVTNVFRERTAQEWKSPMPRTAVAIMPLLHRCPAVRQLVAKLNVLLGISTSWCVFFISIRKWVTYARNWSIGSSVKL